MRDLFKGIFFEVRSRCNGRCAFCMASIRHDTRPDVSMSYELYDSVLQQLKDLNYTGRIAYHVNNEPLLFPDLDRFVMRAALTVPKATTQVLTNGTLLTMERANRLVSSGLKELWVNYYSHTRSDLLPTFRAIDNKYGKTIKYMVLLRNEEEILNSRGGTAPNKKCDYTNKAYRGKCYYPYRQFNINGVGLVSKCCADVLFSDPMGDVTKTSIIDIWNGEKFRHVRECLDASNRDALPSCKDCDFGGTKGLTKVK
jgi:MoaA/NifB/PqqE/SkfB family radical SAM enzyme